MCITCPFDMNVWLRNGNIRNSLPFQSHKMLHSYILQDLSLWTKFKVPILGEIRFNPIVSLSAIGLIWGFVIWCAIQGEDVPFANWKALIVAKFTWLYVGSQDLWAVFAVVLYCRLVRLF